MRGVRGLLVLVAMELMLSGLWLGVRLARPRFPVHNEEILDPYTSESLDRLRSGLSVDDAQAWTKLGEAYLAHGSYQQAEACFRRSDELDPGVAANAYTWGICLGRLGLTSEANSRLVRIVDTVPQTLRPEVWYRIGKNLLREEKPDKAEEVFRNVPGFPERPHETRSYFACAVNRIGGWQIRGRWCDKARQLVTRNPPRTCDAITQRPAHTRIRFDPTLQPTLH